MRDAFARKLLEVAAADDRVVLLSGDIGNRMFDAFKERFPKRFFNCGVAEQSMMGVAAGMALSGLRPIVYTIVPFVTTRCLEQIRVDVCYHNAPVTIVGVGGGLCYANLGATHHACEDIALLRALPGMTVVCPGDPIEVGLALEATVEQDSPLYVRLGKKGEPTVHQQPPPFQIGRGITLRDGDDVTLLSTGNILPTTIQVADALQSQDIEARVVSLHTVKPLDEELLTAAFAETEYVITLEEHSIIGGLGSAVAEWAADQPRRQFARQIRIGTPDAFLHEAGDPEYARRRCGITADAIVDRVLAVRKSLGSG